ncbi:NUDIX domain-containing protein [Streptomyces sp. TRM 70361]|uniref:NUDIX domain-containing protein n=1 Tax=Streptomyces sp. TRM 70361 TaxID=3116553 RepID=UPI002E7B9AEE|nr:NUDIX domain-containing protein [Streptomyces sp. TRM 70361]MEE1938784.1 NUDIX domain-containing protein [Streptomyces sp. TRM 70361]
MGFTPGRIITHCPYCGTGYPENAGWPRDCAGCGETSWANPLPVAVALQPVTTAGGGRGVVVVRRDIEPFRGELALPGGYMELGETWQQAAVRELWEETGLEADAGRMRLFDAHSSPRTLLVFGLLPARDAASLPPSAPTAEATEWLVLQEPVELAFPAHTEALRAYLAGEHGAGAAPLG